MPYTFDHSMDHLNIYTERQIDFLTPELRAKYRRRTYKPGDILCRAGDEIRYIRFIESGSCTDALDTADGLRHSSFILDTTDGSIGLMEIFCLQRRIVSTLVALEPTVILDLPVKYVYENIMRDPSLVLKYSFILAKALLATSDREQLIHLRSPERVSYYLVHYCSSVMKDGADVTVAETYDSIGAQIGVSGKTVARRIRELEAEGLVGRKGKHITVSFAQYKKLAKQF